MQDDFSPEEKLLRLIKGKRTASQASQSRPQPQAKDDNLSPVADVEIEQKEFVSKEETPRRQRKAFSKRTSVSQSFTFLYIISFVIIVILAIAFFYTIFANSERKELRNLKRMIKELSEKNTAKPPTSTEPSSQKKDMPSAYESTKRDSSFDEYQKLLSTKNIFSSPTMDKKDEAVSEGPTLRELVAELRLVGIMPGDEPQAILEDKRSGQTFFLKKGEYIDSIQIREISSGKVILGKGEETITLSL